jgi:uncharacterized membrane protein YciS (DUF1049 family)
MVLLIVLMKLLTQNNNLIEPNYLIHDINLRQYTITIIILVTVGVLLWILEKK